MQDSAWELALAKYIYISLIQIVKHARALVERHRALASEYYPFYDTFLHIHDIIIIIHIHILINIILYLTKLSYAECKVITCNKK